MGIRGAAGGSVVIQVDAELADGSVLWSSQMGEFFTYTGRPAKLGVDGGENIDRNPPPPMCKTGVAMTCGAAIATAIATAMACSDGMLAPPESDRWLRGGLGAAADSGTLFFAAAAADGATLSFEANAPSRGTLHSVSRLAIQFHRQSSELARRMAFGVVMQSDAAEFQDNGPGMVVGPADGSAIVEQQTVQVHTTPHSCTSHRCGPAIGLQLCVDHPSMTIDRCAAGGRPPGATPRSQTAQSTWPTMTGHCFRSRASRCTPH